jgi:tripartite-type tricarboxylate transporter receptor subunit TctC
MRPVLRLLLLTAALAIAHPHAAAGYPDKSIRVVAPFPAGGTADALARAVTAQMEQQVGRSIVIDNRGGANGIIGTDIVAKAAPDGYTLLHVTGSFVVNPHVYRQLPYDIHRDFAPVTNLALGDGYLLLVHPSVPAQTTPEFIALAKQPASRVTYGSPGVGNTLHLAAELFNVRAGIQVAHVPYKGVAPAMNALVGGEVNSVFMPPTVALSLIKAGRLRALGYTGATRWAPLPDVPTISESGVPGFVLRGGWHGWFAPARTPAAIVERIYAEVKKALQVPKVREYVLAGGYEPEGSSPAEFRKFVRAEWERYAEMVRAAKIQPQ